MAWGILITAMLLWSSSFVAAKIVLVDFTPEQAVGLRLCLAALISLPWLLTLGRPLLKTLTASHWRWLLLMSFFEPCLYFLAEMNGLVYTSASAASLVTSTMPLWVVIGAWLLLRERINRNTIGGITMPLPVPS